MPDRYFYPEILSADDLRLMHETVREVLSVVENANGAPEPEAVARIVLRLYRIGLTDRDKLVQLAELMAESRPVQETVS
ncbi:hypothetical protein REJC140_02591 [Pseudorhizobium endolithicum]|uniref:Uncharacterized protein n=1 Tax=Pseudorhizobium endolithicum TaxID=1191678 RepID=A0ABM8PGC6_9HYPH|nr:hypothetical protein [Pseudorhizobium endolithicum]CAD6421862.1 hypothetical protein REQ54_02284 [Rhizobium sp. Q54]CAD7028158.1 hypothetical protein REJC140_02591 [Pseudorhizobium endolithicum]